MISQFILPHTVVWCMFLAMKQAHFFQSLGHKKISLSHGGDLAKGRRKTRRPLDTKKPLHLVMRSSKASGALSLLKHKIIVDKIIQKQARKFGVRIAAFANVGNHCHLLVRFSNRKAFQAFLISVTALIARAVTKASKGKPFGKFWDALAFSRVLKSSREFAIVRKYVAANVIEATKGREARYNFLASKYSWELRMYSN